MFMTGHQARVKITPSISEKKTIREVAKEMNLHPWQVSISRNRKTESTTHTMTLDPWKAKKAER